MDKQRIMKMNSVKCGADSFIMMGNFLYSYSKVNDRITLEQFDFTNMTKTVILNTNKASKDFPALWDIDSSFAQLEYLLGTYDHDKVDLTEIPLTEV